MSKNTTFAIIVIIVAIVAAGAGFFGGIQYQKSHQSGWMKGAQNVENVFTGK